jgi:hypothetical protein
VGVLRALSGKHVAVMTAPNGRLAAVSLVCPDPVVAFLGRWLALMRRGSGFFQP